MNTAVQPVTKAHEVCEYFGNVLLISPTLITTSHENEITLNGKLKAWKNVIKIEAHDLACMYISLCNTTASTWTLAAPRTTKGL